MQPVWVVGKTHVSHYGIIQEGILNIAVTGGAGFIGSHLVERLASDNHQVIILDNFNDFYSPPLKRNNAAKLAKNEKVKVIEVDLLDFPALQSVFESNPFDQVVHLAAYAGVTPSIQSPLLYEEVNIRGTLNLLELCRKHQIKNFTFASSSSVYGGNTKIPFSESDPVNQPICPYAATKRAAELLCFTYAFLHGMNIPCLRFFTVYGPRQRPEMAIVKFIRMIDLNQEITLYGNGEYSRDYTYIDDIINGVVASMQRRNGYEIFNLGGSRTTSLNELIQMLEKIMGKKAIVKHQPCRAGEVEITFADIAHSEKILGYRPAMPLEEGLARTVRWYQELGFVWE